MIVTHCKTQNQFKRNKPKFSMKLIFFVLACRKTIEAKQQTQSSHCLKSSKNKNVFFRKHLVGQDPFSVIRRT